MRPVSTRTWFACVGILAFAAGAGLWWLSRPTGGAPAGRAPAISGAALYALEFKDLEGSTQSLGRFQGKWTVVNFWATWCAPCVAEMPSLERLHRRMGPDLLQIVGVNFQENAARIEPFVQRLRLTFPIVRDHDGGLRKAWQVNVFPSTFVISPQGRVAYVVTGEIDWDDPTVESRLRSLR